MLYSDRLLSSPRRREDQRLQHRLL